jgi:peptidoglycan/LPS O-acetylase OafA/YrhL
VNQVTQVLGKISFSLYLWHPLMIGFLRDLSVYEWIYQTIDNVVGAFLMSAVATFAVLIPVAAATYIYIERPDMNLFRPSRRERV